MIISAISPTVVSAQFSGSVELPLVSNNFQLFPFESFMYSKLSFWEQELKPHVMLSLSKHLTPKHYIPRDVSTSRCSARHDTGAALCSELIAFKPLTEMPFDKLRTSFDYTSFRSA